MTIKVPETFRPEKDLEEKIDKLAKKIELIEENMIISTRCCKYKDRNKNILLKFDKGKPVGIICDEYDKTTGKCFDTFSKHCRYVSGFDPLQPNPDEGYKR